MSERRVAVILAGGKGTRLAPIPLSFRNPGPPGAVSVVEILVRQLVSFGFNELIFSTGYLAELLEAYFTTIP